MGTPKSNPESEKKHKRSCDFNDPKITCDHEVTIPGLDAYYCQKCDRWVWTDLEMIARRKRSEMMEQKKKRKKI